MQTKTRKRIDTYCGIGNIGLAARGKAMEVIGVELNAEAARDAGIYARENKIQNAKFYCDYAGKFMVKLADAGEKIDVVFMDPQRSGSTEEFIDCVGMLVPPRVVYVSCDPETQLIK